MTIISLTKNKQKTKALFYFVDDDDAVEGFQSCHLNVLCCLIHFNEKTFKYFFKNKLFVCPTYHPLSTVNMRLQLSFSNANHSNYPYMSLTGRICSKLNDPLKTYH